MLHALSNLSTWKEKDVCSMSAFLLSRTSHTYHQPSCPLIHRVVVTTCFNKEYLN
jgi:hypothetical protein